MQHKRADLIGDQHHLDVPGAGGADDVGDPRQIGLVLGIDGNGHEFQRGSIGQFQKRQGFVERQIAPAFAHLDFHVVDQHLEVLHIARDRACDDRCRIRLQGCDARHRLSSFQARVFGRHSNSIAHSAKRTKGRTRKPRAPPCGRAVSRWNRFAAECWRDWG